VHISDLEVWGRDSGKAEHRRGKPCEEMVTLAKLSGKKDLALFFLWKVLTTPKGHPRTGGGAISQVPRQGMRSHSFRAPL